MLLALICQGYAFTAWGRGSWWGDSAIPARAEANLAGGSLRPNSQGQFVSFTFSKLFPMTLFKILFSFEEAWHKIDGHKFFFGIFPVSIGVKN